MRRGVIVLAGVGALAVAGLAIARAAEYHGAAKPGVHVLGQDVGGKSRSAIEAVVRRWAATPVTIRASTRSYHVPRGWLVSVDVAGTATRALHAGSVGSLLVARRVDVEPTLAPAAEAGDVLIALGRSGRAPVSAKLAVDGVELVVTPARKGRRLDRTRLLRLLETGAGDVRAPYTTLRPAITTAAASAAAARARTLIAEPVGVGYHGARLGSLSRAQLARALTVDRQAHGYAVAFDGARLARLLRPRLGRWIQRARNARFVVHGDAVSVSPSRPGHDLVPAQVAAAVASAAGGNHLAALELGPRQADLTTAKARALGIRTKLVSYTTQMGDSSSNRIHNVHLMADFIDGTVIAPGEEFSFNRVVGPRTAERGFLEGQEIIGSLVLPSIGGGVCQTATTLFNDAFEAGLPILARINHNLYLAHYPLGRDATVAWGGPDFRFRNDLRHGILIKTSYTDQTLTFTFYGTPEGRRVVSHTSKQTNWTKPGMSYAVDPRAPRGSKKVVKGTGELGFDVTVTRTVYDAGGKRLRHDVFKSHYIPDSDTTVYGPGRTPPGPYIVLPTTL
jgi:vancomycin resistance protein YoaR